MAYASSTNLQVVKKLHVSCRVLLITCCFLLHPLGSTSTCEVLGVHPSQCSKYTYTASASEEGKFFYCGDSPHKKIPMKNVNDDYCDCPSNDDEPGTSACNKGKFWCNNVGYRGRYIFSSLVNDGICDCCDGSDEVNNARVECHNVCADKAKQEMAEFVQQKKKYTQGIKVKQSLLQVAKSKLNEKRQRKQQIEQQLGDKRQELQQKEAVKKAAEDKEREYKEEKKKKAADEKQRKRLEKIHLCESEGGAHCEEKAAETETPPTDTTQTESNEKEEKEEAAETDRERRRRERRERFEQRMQRNQQRKERQRAEREAAKQQQTESEPEPEEAETAHHEHTPDEEFPYPEQYRPHEDNAEQEKLDESGHHEHTPDEEFPYPEQYRPHEDTDDVGVNVDDDAFDWSQFDEDEEEEYDEAEMAYSAEGVVNEEEEAEEADPVLDALSDTARDARNEYNDVNREVRDLEKDLKEIDKVLGMDFGEKNIYACLFDECFSSKIGKYNYEFCPFGKASQKEGHSSTDLGAFKSVAYNEKRELEMKFEDGQKCWNGPKRSATVTFLCDTENEIVAVTEPSTCKYHMTFHTPLACLQEELDKINHIIQNQFKTEL